jgi:hypothetical protein
VLFGIIILPEQPSAPWILRQNPKNQKEQSGKSFTGGKDEHASKTDLKTKRKVA